MFVIEDEIHCELQPGRYGSLAEAIAELRRLSTVPWDAAPNLAPCTGWRKCGRWWAVVEYDDSTRPWRTLRRERYLDVGAAAVRWVRGVA